jgi:cytosine/creatinine deaminase
VVALYSQECSDLLTGFIAEKPEIWNEDIGEEI